MIDDPLSRFIAQIVVIVTTARLLGRGARRIGQPLVVAEIVAGIVLGPSVLGWVAPDVSAALFPEASLDALRIASQLGLVLFVFLVGLELEPEMLRGRLRASLAISLASIAVPFVLGALLALRLVEIDPPAGSQVAFALFLGVALSITAFPVLARMLAEERLLRTRIGALAIACAAIDDAVAWCLLAFVVGLARSSGMTSALATTLLALAFVAAMLLIVRPLARRLVERRSRPVTVTPDVIALVLVAMLACAWTTERIGIHVVFGAFLFGAVVPKRDGFARAIAEKLEDVVVIVLVPLFFAISGLRTHIDLVASAGNAGTCAAVLVVACAGKFGGSALAARLTGLSWRDAGTLGVLMNTRGLIELIVINIGFEVGVFSPTVFSMLVLMVLVTTMATMPIVRRLYPAAHAARDVLAAEPPSRPKPPYRVMMCISHEQFGPPLVTIAHALAGGDAEAIALHLAAVDEPTPAVEPADVLEPALARATELGLTARPLAFVSQDPADDIVRLADVRDADLVLLALRQPAAAGGIANQVLQRVGGAVAVYVDHGMRDVPARVLVPFAGSADDRAALVLASRVHRATGAEITVLRSAAGAGDLGDVGGHVLVETVSDMTPAEAAIERSHAFDLVVVGAGRDWEPRLLRDCTTSLLVVRGPLATAHRAEG